MLQSPLLSKALLLVLLLQTFVLLVLDIGTTMTIFNCNYRFLATKESYRSFAFQFRIHHSWISVIFRQTLNAVCERLQKVAIPEPNEETLILRWVIPVVLSRCKRVKKIRFVCSHKTQLTAKLSLFLSYDMFRPTITAIVRLYMKPLTHMP